MDQNIGRIPQKLDHLFQFSFEARLDVIKTHEWFGKNLMIPVLGCVIYLFAVFSLQRLMKYRKPLALDGLLFSWNLMLAVFSALATVRTFPEFFHVLWHFGFRQSICNSYFTSVCKVTSFWGACFVLSKIIELFDTAFVVLRKKPVSFLHVFHHCSVLVFSWMVIVDQSAVGRWYKLMNLAVHSAMYSYYALRTLRVKVPRWLAKCLTVVQIVQMIVGLFVSLAAYGMALSQGTCQSSLRTVLSGTLLYSLYGVLFVNYFARSYLYPKLKVT